MLQIFHGHDDFSYFMEDPLLNSLTLAVHGVHLPGQISGDGHVIRGEEMDSHFSMSQPSRCVEPGSESEGQIIGRNP